VYKSATNTEFL